MKKQSTRLRPNLPPSLFTLGVGFVAFSSSLHPCLLTFKLALFHILRLITKDDFAVFNKTGH